MIYIALTVLANVLIFILFKLFDKYHINTFQAIIVNYLFAFAVAVYFSGGTFSPSAILQTTWIWGAVVLGFMFIVGFYLVAITTQRLGMSVVAVSSKMSVAIPVLFGILAYGESTQIAKLLGIALALIAVYLTSYTQTKRIHKADLILPMVLFVSSGLLDTTLKYLQTHYIPDNQTSQFLSIVFLLAGVLGALLLLYRLLKGQATLSLRNLYAGLLLGFINYFSMYFLLNALQTQGLESATVFTVNNVSIVMLSTLLGVLLFKEKLLRVNMVGLALAVVSIVIISLA